MVSAQSPKRDSEGSALSRLLEFVGFYLRPERDPNLPKLNLKLVKQMWDLTVPFWTRSGAWVSYLVLCFYGCYTFGSAVLAARVAKLVGDQMEALASHDAARFYRVIVLALAANLGVALLVLLIQLPFSILLLRWRQWLTKRFINEYLQNDNYYFLNRDRVIDNPDERLSIDIALFVDYPASVVTALVSCLSNLFVFGFVLWKFAWYLVVACALYYFFYSVISLFLTRPIMNLQYIQRKLDGDFRFSLVNVRVNAEPIAFLRGERVERKELFRRLDLLIDNFVRSAWWTDALITWLQASRAFAQLLPGLLIAPLVLKGKLTISAFSQAQVAWSQLGSAFGFFGSEALTFAFGGAVIARVHALQQHCLQRPEPTAVMGRIERIASDHIAARNFTLMTPDGARTLVRDLDFTLAAGDRLMITGANGAGKSSLLRGLAGLWTRGSGELYLPPHESIMFLPQRPYMSLGSLREQVTYPDNQELFGDDDAIRTALERVELGHLEDRFGGMDMRMDWNHVLSPGEQQRIGFSRVFLRRSEFVILDEATSAIDSQGEQFLYALLQQMGCSYISVAHRETLIQYHRNQLELAGEGQWKLTSIADLLTKG